MKKLKLFGGLFIIAIVAINMQLTSISSGDITLSKLKQAFAEEVEGVTPCYDYHDFHSCDSGHYQKTWGERCYNQEGVECGQDQGCFYFSSPGPDQGCDEFDC